MANGSNDEVVAIDAAAVLAASDTVTGHARALRAAGADPAVTVPEDHFELDELLAELDRVRSAFEATFTTGVASAALRMAEVAMAAFRADVFPTAADLPATLRAQP